MKELFARVGRTLYERVWLHRRQTVYGILAAAGAILVDELLKALLPALPSGWSVYAAPVLIAAGAWAKGKLKEVEDAGGLPPLPPAALVLVIGAALLLASPARGAVVLGGDQAAAAPAAAPAPTRTFGGCNALGTLCYGPTVSLSLVGMDLGTGKFTGGIIPGAGYGVTFFADKPYQLGVGGYAAIQAGPETTSGLFSIVASFAEYVRIGAARQIIGAEHNTLLLLGLGADIK